MIQHSGHEDTPGLTPARPGDAGQQGVLAPPGAGLGLATAPNLRDVGGWPTRDGGRVASGVLYRSTDLSRLAGPDVEAFAGLGIRSVYDLRTPGERATAPDVLPAGAEYHVLDVLADSKMAVPANLMVLLADPPAATAELTGTTVTRLFDSAYREIVGLPSARASFRRLFTDLAAPDRHPALVHCTTGKDRTGWAAAALLLLLGVSDDDVLAEYLLTNDLLLPALEPMFDQFRAAGGDPAVLVPVFGVDRAYLTAGLDEMTSRFRSIEGYFSEGLGMEAHTIQALRQAFTERT